MNHRADAGSPQVRFRAADFSDALLKTSFVASKVIAEQLAIPLTKKIARMLAGTAGTEVVDHGLHSAARAGSERSLHGVALTGSEGVGAIIAGWQGVEEVDPGTRCCRCLPN